MSEPILVTRALTKKYGGAAAVEGVDLYIEKGQIYGLVGRNGAGKTTIIRMLTAQTVPRGGSPGRPVWTALWSRWASTTPAKRSSSSSPWG